MTFNRKTRPQWRKVSSIADVFADGMTNAPMVKINDCGETLIGYARGYSGSAVYVDVGMRLVVNVRRIIAVAR